MRLMLHREMLAVIKVAVKTRERWLVRRVGTDPRDIDWEASVARLAEEIAHRICCYPTYMLNTSPWETETFEQVPLRIRLADIAEEDRELLVHMRQGEECLHNPGFKGGEYFCCKPVGHTGPHDYVPGCCAVISIPREEDHRLLPA